MIYRKSARLLTVLFLSVALFVGAIGGLAALDGIAYAAPNPQTSYMYSLTTLGRIFVNGASDVNQLTVQGYTTQTNNLLVLEQSDGTDVLTVTNGGNLTTQGQMFADGSSDVNQLTVQGYTTQTNNLLVLEQSDGTDVLTVTNAGDMFMTGLDIGSSSQITGTDGQTITPTKSLYILDSAADITITLAACAHNNQPLALFGNDDNTILVADSDLRSTDGAAISIGQYDLVALKCIGAEWIHQSTSANE